MGELLVLNIYTKVKVKLATAHGLCNSVCLMIMVRPDRQTLYLGHQAMLCLMHMTLFEGH